MSTMFKDLSNKNIIVTGGLGFLASQFTEALIECNCNVILVDIKNIKKKNNLKNLFYFKCDITKDKQVALLSKKIKKKFKNIDVLINNAANNPKPSSKNNSFETFDVNEWDNDLNISLKGSFLCTKYFGKIMKIQKNGGNIINISSDLGVIAPDQRIYKKIGYKKPVTYSVTKHGIIGLTKYTATYWPKKVRCNSISPGGMANGQSKLFLNEVKKLIPLGRLAKKNEFNSLILFLASNASSYITGSNIIIDGGRTSW
jgi:NAD(P)-dependent dehydrogenase (short-subunit alcohol dehydrogenase family)